MSVVTLGDHAPKLTAEIHSTASKAGLRIPESHIDDFASLLGALDQSVQKILDADDYWPIPDLTEYPRTNITIPQGAVETDKGGWATKCIAKSISATSGLLKGRSVALKDNVALAGVRCTNGTAAMEWTPEVDATVATRIMDAGGIITGKAACENACLEGVSDTSMTGKVHNPYADGYSAGGSSSGSGRLVASGAVDLAIGCDQGGSIRIPSSNCGIVGLKPTWGLVPYTGIISLECTIDHVGPMARNVPDVSRLLEAIAGPDGVDDRQSTYLPPQTLQYTSQLDGFLSSSLKDPSKSLEGIKVGMLQEAFNMANMDANIKRVCEAAVSKLRDLGAEVRDVSVPTHRNAAIVWMCYLPIAGGQPGLLSNMSGRKQLYMTDRVIKSGRRLTQESFDALGPSAQNFYLRYLYLDEKYGPELQAKCSNLIRKNNDEYDRALREVDVLVMPTLPSPPCKLFEDPASHGPTERLSRNVGLVANTSPFNNTGHPALTIPVGFVPAHDDHSIFLPTGLQIVGNKLRDIDCMKVGAAWERAYDWKATT